MFWIDIGKKYTSITNKILLKLYLFGYRNPNYDTNEVNPFVWDPIKSEKIEFLHIKGESDTQMDTNLLPERRQFWSNLPTRSDQKYNKVQDEL